MVSLLAGGLEVNRCPTNNLAMWLQCLLVIFICVCCFMAIKYICYLKVLRSVSTVQVGTNQKEGRESMNELKLFQLSRI